MTRGGTDTNTLESVPHWLAFLETVRLNLADVRCTARGHNTRVITAQLYCVRCERWV